MPGWPRAGGGAIWRWRDFIGRRRCSSFRPDRRHGLQHRGRRRCQCRLEAGSRGARTRRPEPDCELRGGAKAGRFTIQFADSVGLYRLSPAIAQQSEAGEAACSAPVISPGTEAMSFTFQAFLSAPDTPDRRSSAMMKRFRHRTRRASTHRRQSPADARLTLGSTAATRRSHRHDHARSW